MEKLYTDKDYADLVATASETGKVVYKIRTEEVVEEETVVKESIEANLPGYYVCSEANITDGTLNPDFLDAAKARKQAENVQKCNEKRYNQTFTVELQNKDCEFDTSAQTQSDLQTAAIVTGTGTTYDNWVTNNGVVLNLTAEDVQTVFATFFALVSPLYAKQLNFSELIEACETLEELENINIDYESEVE